VLLFLKGDEGDAFYEVESGQIRISACAPGGREVILATMGPGDAFGEIALLDGLARTADAIATRNSELLMLRRRDFVALLERVVNARLDDQASAVRATHGQRLVIPANRPDAGRGRD